MATVEALAALARRAGILAVLTGAGVSTASGIPGYRDREGHWQHARPVDVQDFLRSDKQRRRYWARSLVGWQRVAAAEPNTAHAALAALEAAGRVDTLTTQNVDGLHQRAGSRQVIDLHGRLDTVACVACGWQASRGHWQAALLAANPGGATQGGVPRPDGDAALPDAVTCAFNVPDCPECSGIVKPAVVFFGEAVPRERVSSSMRAVERAGALLVAGSSLMVWSGLRFVRRAVELGKPVAIVNQGRTRADDCATLKVDDDCGTILAALVQVL